MNIKEVDTTVMSYASTKTSKTYSIKDEKGKVMSSLDYYDYSKKNFNWILIADVETKEKYRGMGFASKLVNELYKDITQKSPDKGIYLLVRSDNTGAIKFYKKTGFSFIKKYKITNGDNQGIYDVMCRGKGDKQQLVDMNFG